MVMHFSSRAARCALRLANAFLNESARTEARPNSFQTRIPCAGNTCRLVKGSSSLSRN